MVFGGLAALCYLVSFAWNLDMRAERWIVHQAQLPALLIEFWFGMVLGQAVPLLARSGIWRACTLAGGVALLAGLFAWYPQAITAGLPPRPFGFFNVLSALGYAMVLAAGLAWREVSPAAQTRGPGQKVAIAGGALSYGVYLFHGVGLAGAKAVAAAWPPIARIGLALTFTVSMSWLLHCAVEMPLRSLGRRLSGQPPPA
jgi:peptidoglycan/LPS O-acetylase OafA/YrhL